MITQKISYLKPLFYFIISGLLIMTLSRLALFFIYNERILEVNEYWKIFTFGLRFDLIVMCYLSFIPALIISFVPEKANRAGSIFLSIYSAILLFFIFVTEVTTPEFIDQYDTRPNKIFLEYLIYPKEIFNMLLKGRLLTTTIVGICIVALVVLLIKIAPKLFKVRNSSYKLRLLIFPFLAFFLFWGARGSLTTRRPINASNSVFSTDQMVNSLGVNSFYTVAYAGYSLKHEEDPRKHYGKMEKEEAYARVKKYMDIDQATLTNPDIPFMHQLKSDTLLKRPYNLVIFLQESLGAEYVGALGGKPLTPNFDQLSKEGLLFTNLYCTGTRSVRGIEAVVTGFLPSTSESVVKLPNSQSNFFTLGNLLKEKGYDTSFIYGGMANFDNMASFFSGNGFSNIIDETVFDKQPIESYALKGVWGYSDEDLVVKANEYFKSVQDKPFFSLMFSTSNHEPFEFPDNRIELYEQPKNSVHNAMKYADFAIGEFFKLARKEEYFKNTVFVIIADHNTRTQGKALVPIDKFHIPALIIAPNIEEATFDKLASQIDIPPTLVSLLGIDAKVPMVGHNLLAKDQESRIGRSLMQFHDIYAFRVEDQVIILQPKQKPLQFIVKSDTELIPTEVDEELAKDALAHVLTPYYMYKDRSYRLAD